MGIFYAIKRKLSDIERFFRRNWFKLFHGYNYEDTWNLDHSLAKWLIPRLKHLRDNTHGYPGTITYEEWIAILNKMITAFELIEADEYWMTENPQNLEEQVEEGLDLFREYYFALWD